MSFKHIPVMVNEVLRYMDCQRGKIYVDCTLGGAGHSKAILGKIIPDGMLIGIDQDEDAIENAKNVLKPFAANTRLFHDNFIHFQDVLSQLNIPAVDGILLDLGISLHQLESSGRGFSFKRDEPLDMRMDKDSSPSAEEIINRLDEGALRKIFHEYGEERWARRIAKQIVKARSLERIRSSRQLARIVLDAVPSGSSSQRIHPATRVFMAIRIEVNRELENLDRFMKNAVDYLNDKGRLCILSFHSLEDRIVKRRIKALEKGCVCPPDFPKCVCNKKQLAISLSRKAVRPSGAEVQANPMSRSAKLRAMEKISI